MFEASYLLAELQAHSTQLCISSLAIDEAWWALLREWVRRDLNIRLTGNYLKAHRDLLPHLAILQGLGITDVVTEDRDFDDVDGLTLYRFH